MKHSNGIRIKRNLIDWATPKFGNASENITSISGEPMVNIEDSLFDPFEPISLAAAVLGKQNGYGLIY
jgi:hypothetical protein